MLTILGFIDLCLIFATFCITRGRLYYITTTTTKVVREQCDESAAKEASADKEEARASAHDDTITLPSSVAHCKEPETKENVVRWIFVLIPVACLCMAVQCVLLAVGVTVRQLPIMFTHISVQNFELTLNPSRIFQIQIL